MMPDAINKSNPSLLSILAYEELNFALFVGIFRRTDKEGIWW